MELAADLIQDFCANHLKIPEMSATCSFPAEFDILNSDVLVRIKESNQLKSHFAANISESIQLLKVNVVKAEASLLIGDVTSMRKHYAVV